MTDFNDFASEYEAIMQGQLSFFDSDSAYFARYKVQILRELRRGRPGRILEYGCGIGRNLPHLTELFPGSSLWGCDISARSLEYAASKNPEVNLLLSAPGLDWAPEEPFDLIFAACVFHHIPPGERVSALEQIRGLLAPWGLAVIFEHNPFNPVTRRMVSTCPFDRDAILLRPSETETLLRDSGFIPLASRYCLFFPSSLKRLSPLERYLGLFPLGGQYYTIALADK